MNKETWISPEQARDALESGNGKGVRIAILDSGVETSHPQLKNLTLSDDVIIQSRGGVIEAVEGSGEDVFGHGSAVADIIHRHAPDAEIGSFRVLGHFKESRAAVIREGVKSAARKGYDIIQCSFGAPARAQDAAIYKAWLDALYLRSVHVVAAGSNSGFHTAEWPAHFPTVIAVGADPNDGDSIQLRRGSLVEFATRGRESSAAWLGGSSKEVIGSSFAAPRVTAMLARILSVFPGLHPLHAKSLLRQIAEERAEN
ncbi:S8 family serine peptidase [Verrucomicrobiaceae bacterium 5K15]|uniref:S8 family serine peptidase n=1 Tax=Oceaniferula flava TaxID=2800421 RepID=A0AAE2SB36_9BACT|nr:S8 family serine peptidase [Oceaniferula flavus]MBK1853644.1 S8 family serine peptidase [Oceaniferula flavus]MBM1134949.1 S8 family serine peptidase [Oceaniferula flavus]